MTRVLCLLLFAGAACAQFHGGATIGRAGVHDLTYRSSMAVQWNAATLGPGADSAMTALDALSFNFGAANNAFDIRFWNDEIASSQYLTLDKKQAILNRIEGDEFTLHADASAPLIGGAYKKVGVSVAVESALFARAPRELFELALYGNQLDRSYDLGRLDGEQYTILNVGAGFAYEFQQDWIPGLYAGISFHYYHGLYYETVATAEGELLITDSLITGYTQVQRINADRGDGVGFDLGGLAQLDDRWTFGAALRQIGSSMTWDVNENEVLLWSADSAGIVVDSLDDDNYLERAFASTDTTYYGGQYESEIPVIIEFDAHYKATDKLNLLSTLLIRTQESAQGDNGPEFGVAGDYRALPWLPVFGGVSYGGTYDWRFGIGGGLRTRNYDLSIGWNWSHGFFDSARGVSFGLSQQFRF